MFILQQTKYNALIGKTINFHGEYGLDGTATAYEMYGVGIGGHSGPGAGYYWAAPTLIIQTILKPCIQLEEQRVAQAASRVDPSLKPSHSSVSPLTR